MKAPSELEPVLATLRRQLGGQLVAEVALPARSASYADLEPPPPEPIARALISAGLERLWSHQVAALSAARARRDVLITTATASGKSLVFQLPVLEEALLGGPGRALWLFPLKALGQDQRGKLEMLAAACGLGDGRCRVEIYDGDTPATARARIRRDPPRVLITNPDMLHMGILAHPGAWATFLAELQWVVLDELHAYRGIFGCHLHHVLARLERLARVHGSRPAYVAASATAAEADRFAAAIAGRTFEWVSESGAPREARTFLFTRPAASPYTVTLDLMETLLAQGQKTIVFTKARRITELLYTWLERRAPRLARRVRSYRAGFLASERREIERDLASGRLDGVISTSALELGIDIGGLDACVLVGWPGSVMATWQRSGRVGRGGRESVTVLVALPDALDQYLLDHPNEMLDRPCERLVVDPGNEVVARGHLICAAAERPLSLAEGGAWLERHAPVVGDLLRGGHLVRTLEGDRLVARSRRPQREISLRGAGASFAIVDEEREVTIGTIDAARVRAECHPGAIYLHGGRQYGVTGLDLERREARVRPAEVDYFTSPLSEKETEILEPLAQRRLGGLDAAFGRLLVTERIVGFERKKTHGLEVIDRQALELPAVAYETQGLWVRAPAPATEALERGSHQVLGALHATEHAAIGLFPLVALCDRSDLGGISLTFHPQLAGGGVFIYEGHEGGVGICARGFEELPDLLARVRDHLARCPCRTGCPSCVQSPKCGNGNRPLDKAGAIAWLDLLLAGVDLEAWRAQTPAPAPAPRLSDLFAGRFALPEPARAASNGEEKETPEERSEVAMAGVVRGGRAKSVAGMTRQTKPGEERHRKGKHREEKTREIEATEERTREEKTREEKAREEETREEKARALEETGTEGTGNAARKPREEKTRFGGGHAGSGGGNGADEAACGEGARLERDPLGNIPSGTPAGSRFSSERAASLDPLLWSFRPEEPPRSAAAPEAGAGVGKSRREKLGERGAVRARPVQRGEGPTVLFDVETLRSAEQVGGWHRAHRMGIAVAVSLELETGAFRTFFEPAVPELAVQLKSAGLVIGFNSLRFDYAVLSGYTGEDYARTLPSLDLLESLRGRLGYRVGLGHLAEETLGRGKSADGLQSLEWVRQGRLDLVEAYCRQDVEVLRDLYLFGRREGYVVVRDRSAGPLRIEVDW